MARKPRVQFAGALYHVMCRSNQVQDWESWPRSDINRPKESSLTSIRSRRRAVLAMNQKLISSVVTAVPPICGPLLQHAVRIAYELISFVGSGLADKLGKDGELQRVTENIRDTLRSGKRAKRSIRSARPHSSLLNSYE